MIAGPDHSTAMNSKRLLTLIALLACTAAQAQAYRWKDASGKTIISDLPPPKTVTTTSAESSAPPPPPPPQGRSLADQDLEFKKRQIAAREKAEKDEKDRARAEELKAYCDQTRRQIAQLESGERIMVREENGERRPMEDPQRAQELKTARKGMQENCK